MDEFFSRGWADMIGRMEGPMHFRVIDQPLLACFLAIRAGLRDAREGKPPFLWALTFDPDQRRDLLRKGWKDIARVFLAALLLDVVYQVIALQMAYPGEAVIVAIVLALIPYLLLRPAVTRIADWKRQPGRQ